jgi:hypothetical protein
MSTLGDNSYEVSQIKIWLPKFRNGDLSCKDSPLSVRPLLTLGPQPGTFIQKCPFGSSRVIAQHFLTTIPTINDILQRELEMRKFSRRRVPHFLSPARKIARVKSSKTILRVLHDAESNDFKGIAVGDESWLRYCYPSSTMCARSPSEVIPRTRQTIGSKQTMITIVFTAHQLILWMCYQKEAKLISSISSIRCFRISKRKTRIFIVECRLQLFGCTWMIQWFKSSVKIRQVSHCTIAAPTLFARLEPVRLLALRDVERNYKGPRVSFV